MDFRLLYNVDRSAVVHRFWEIERHISADIRWRLVRDFYIHEDSLEDEYPDDEEYVRERKRNNEFIDLLPSYTDMYPALVYAKFEYLYLYDKYHYFRRNRNRINNDDLKILDERVEALEDSYDILIQECVEDIERRCDEDWEQYKN
jgi:hypothetical protein